MRRPTERGELAWVIHLGLILGAQSLLAQPVSLQEILSKELQVSVQSETTYEQRVSKEVRISNEVVAQHPQPVMFEQDEDMTGFQASVTITRPDEPSINIPLEKMAKGPRMDPSAPGVALGALWSYQPGELAVGTLLQMQSHWGIIYPAPWMVEAPVQMASPSIPTRRMSMEASLPKAVEWIPVVIQGKWKIQREERDNRVLYRCVDEAPPEVPFEPSQMGRENLVDQLYLARKATWEQLGQEIYASYRDVLQSTPEIDAVAKQVVGGLKGKEAAQALLSWVENNVRYVALQLNIVTGLVPPTAAQTFASRYGDCKAVSVLLSVMAKAVGLRCVPCVVSWGGMLRDPPMPTAQFFNHEIAYFPDLGLFANPATSVAPLGILDEGLYGQRYLEISPEGHAGFIPQMNPREHGQSTDMRIEIQADGSLVAMGEIVSFGCQATDLARIVENAGSPRDAIDALFSPSTYGVTGDIHVSPMKDGTGICRATFSWRSRPAADLLHRAVLPPDMGRLLDLQIVRGLMQRTPRVTDALIGAGVDRMTIKLKAPAGGLWTSLPKPFGHDSDLATFKVSATGENTSELTLDLTLQLSRSRLTADEAQRLGDELKPLQQFLLTPLRWIEATS